MLARFKENRPRLLQELQKQKMINGNEKLASEIAEKVELVEYKKGQALVIQDNTDDDIFFILTGRTSITVNGREMAIRENGQHVGEMALINPARPRSASISAIETTIAARISEADLSLILNNHPQVWKIIAETLAERLFQRNKLVSVPNARPTLFIGSSQEALPVARAIQTALSHDDVKVIVWTDGVFNAGQSTMEDLEHQVNSADFAVLVLSADDKILSREDKIEAPRDNVIFELGLFVGALSRQRTFFAKPRKTKDSDIKIPTDLLGITPLEYTLGDPDDLASDIAPLCNSIRDIIKKKGPK